jgi:hypothetical protein
MPKRSELTAEEPCVAFRFLPSAQRKTRHYFDDRGRTAVAAERVRCLAGGIALAGAGIAEAGTTGAGILVTLLAVHEGAEIAGVGSLIIASGLCYRRRECWQGGPVRWCAVTRDEPERSKIAEAGPRVREIVGSAGLALFYIGGILVVLVAVWFFGRLARRDVRVAEAQGLVILAIAVSAFGMGLSFVSFDSAPLVSLGLGFIGLSLLIGGYAIRFFRTHRA